MTSTMSNTRLQTLLEEVKRIVDNAGAFGGCEIRGDVLVCRAARSAAPASYRVGMDGGVVWVSLVMNDRWLSESIETDLMHNSDKLEDLLEEELVELGWQGERPKYEHFRSDDMLFTFRTALRGAEASDASRVATWLLAYEQCFRRLGDMDAGDDDAA
jgi:hypothetical protein